MQTEQLTFESSLKPFFGGSNAAEHFVAANYFADFRQPVNTATNPESLLTTMAANVMLAKNFEEGSKAVGMKGQNHENDIHNQYVDFLVRTALFHKEIDTPTTMGSGLENVRKSFAEAAEQSLNDKVENLKKNANIDAILASNVVTGFRDIRDTLTYSSLGLRTSDTYLDYINAVLLLASHSLNVAEMTNYASLLAANSNSYDPLNNNVKTTNMKEIIEWLVGRCGPAVSAFGRSTGNFCLTSFWNPASGTSAGANVQSVAAKIDPGNAIAVVTKIVRDLDDTFVTSVAQYAIALYNLVGAQVLKDLWLDATGAISSIQSLFTGLKSNNPLRASLINDLTLKSYDLITGELNSVAFTKKAYTAISNTEFAKRLFNDVFMNWGRLAPEARDFYRAHLHLFRKSDATKSVTIGAMGWHDVMANGNEPLNLDPSRNIYRINIMKVAPGAEETLFAYILPFLPVNGIGDLWYTDDRGVVKSVPHASLEVNTLKNIYKCVYTGTPCVIGGNALQLPLNFDAVKRLDADFQIEDIQIIKNHTRANLQGTSMTATSQKASFNDLFVEDMITRVVYCRDESGLFRWENGNKIYYDSDTVRPENCAGTQLKGDNKKCLRFVRDCILSGKPDDLSKCLSSLRDENMFKVAGDELQNVDPNLAIQILKTFGVGKVLRNDSTYGQIEVPQSYESWFDTVVSKMKPLVRDAILGNTSLGSYLKGVICFVQANPVILNKGLRMTGTGVVDAQPIDDLWLRQLNKKLFVNPLGFSSKLADSQALLLYSTQAPFLSLTTPGSMIPFSNTVIGANPFVSPFGMIGGGVIEDSINRKLKRNEFSSDLLMILMTTVNEDLKRAGIVLKPLDQERIQNGIDDLRKTEKRLLSLYQMLKLISDLSTFFKATGCIPVATTRELSVSDIRSRKDTLEYLSKNINDLQSCIGNNLTQQNSMCSELVKHFSALMDTAAGKQNPAIVNVM